MLYLFYFDGETISAALAACVLRATIKRLSTFLTIKMHTRMIWLEDVLTSK